MANVKLDDILFAFGDPSEIAISFVHRKTGKILVIPKNIFAEADAGGNW